MADPTKFLHSWNLQRDHRLIRLYAYMLGEDALKTINFCKLFWATLFSPILVSILLLCHWMDKLLQVRTELRTQRKAEKKAAAPAPVKPKREHRWIKKFLNGVTLVADKIAELVQRYRRFIILTIIGTVLTAIGFGIDFAITHPVGFVQAVIYGAIAAGSIVALMTIGYFAFYLEERYETWTIAATATSRFLGPKITKPFRVLGRGVKAIGHFLLAGAYAVKYRTCPLVQIIDS